MNKILMPLVLISCAMIVPVQAQTAPPVAVVTSTDGTSPPPPVCEGDRVWSELKQRCVHYHDRDRSTFGGHRNGGNGNSGSSNGSSSSSGDSSTSQN